MSKGVVLFALNNSEVDYISLAETSAIRIREFLKVPVSVITDKVSLKFIKDKMLFDNIVEVDNDTFYYHKSFRDGEIIKKLEWKNSHRDSIFNLTPYEETLVLDADFVVNSNVLNYCWNQPHEFLIYRDSYDLASWRSNKDFEYVSQFSIPFYWATVFYFKKSKNTEIFFSFVSHIKENWEYYNFLYQLSSPTFRNDFAFSIAIHIMNGMQDYDFAKSFPGKLHYILDKDLLVDIKDRSFLFLLNKEKKYIPAKISNIDIHIMNKFSLLRVASNHE